MYLTRVKIDTRDRKKLKDLVHITSIHGWIENCFPKEMEEKTRSRKLWRIDELRNEKYLLLLSETPPEAEVLERYGVPGTVQTTDYDKLLNLLEKGKRARFRITLNPVKSLTNEDKDKRGIIVPCQSIEDQGKYFLERTEKNGFAVEENEFRIVEKGYVELWKKGHQRVKLSKATYQGTLTITDVEKFKKTLIEGMGKKKAYGFGLMTIILEA